MNRRFGVLMTALMISACSTWQRAQLPAQDSAFAPPASSPGFYFATVNATYFGGQGRLKGELGVILAAPNKLLLEVRGPGGTPVSTFACDGETVSLFELEGPRFYTGAASPLSMARLLPLPVEPEVAVDLLRGRLTLPQTELSYEVKGKANRLSGVHPLLGNVVIERLSQDRWVWSLPDEAVRVELSRRSPQGVFQDLMIQAGREQVRLRFSELDTTGDPPEAELFKLTPPPGVTPQRL